MGRKTARFVTTFVEILEIRTFLSVSAIVDMNGDGIVDGSDYSIYDNLTNTQRVTSAVGSSTSKLRIATYNMDADINGATSALPGFYQVLEGIGEEVVQGTYQPLDILSLQETTSNSVTVQPIVDTLNSFYGTIATYSMSSVQGKQSGSAGFGNGPNAIVYNTKTVSLIASIGIGTPKGSTNGEYRQVMRYEFQPIGFSGSAGIFYIYDEHSKSSSGTANQNLRNLEAQIVRNDEATLPVDARVIYSGDLNTGTSNEPSYQTMIAAASPGGVVQGAGNDPLNLPGTWNGTSFTQYKALTESATSLATRDDHQLITSNILNSVAGGIGYVSGSYHTFGNNGSTARGTNTNLASNTVFSSPGSLVQDGPTFYSGSDLLGYLTTASDHLPVVSDYTLPNVNVGPSPFIGGFTASPSTVTAGDSTTLTASNVTDGGSTISAVNFYRETNSTPGLQIGSDTLVGTGTASGTNWSLSTSTAGFAADTYTYYAVAVDAANVSSGSLSTAVVVNAPLTVYPLASWEVNGQTAYGTQGLLAASVATGITNSLGLTHGSGLTQSGGGAANAWGGAKYNATAAGGITGNQFITFGLTVSSGYSGTLTSIDMHYRRSSTGPGSGYWQEQLNGGAWVLIADVPNEFSVSDSTVTSANLPIPSALGLQNLPAGTSVNIRLVPYGASNPAGSFYFGDATGSDLIINGSTAVFAPLVLTGPANFVRLDADGAHIDVWNNTDATGSIAQQVLRSQTSAIVYNGSASDDSLTLDFSADSTPITGGVTYSGAGGNNTLKVIGTSGADTISANASAISFGSNTINYTNAQNLVIDPGSGTDSLTITDTTVSLPMIPETTGVVARTFASLVINSGAKFKAPTTYYSDGTIDDSDHNVLIVSSLSIAGTLDLGASDMIIKSGDLASISNLLKSGFNSSSGYWNGTGISSSAAATDPSFLSTLGVAPNSANSSPLYANFDEQPVAGSDVIVAFTLYGDANLDGQIDGTDYNQIDNQFGTAKSGWINGDFNYDGIVDGSDYTLIDNAFNRQS